MKKETKIKCGKRAIRRFELCLCIGFFLATVIVAIFVYSSLDSEYKAVVD